MADDSGFEGWAARPALPAAWGSPEIMGSDRSTRVYAWFRDGFGLSVGPDGVGQLLPRWQLPDPSRANVGVWIAGAEAGWPWRSLRWRDAGVIGGALPGADSVVSWAERPLRLWRSPTGPASAGPGPGVLPVYPMLGGFVAGSLLYASGLWVVAEGGRGLVRGRRRRRGECLRCGYDMRGAMGTCPECGTPREATT